jgi:hypothetical protein
MSNSPDIRVLSRTGARELNQQEVECVSGAFQGIKVCSFNPITCQLDGQPCKPPAPACGS